MRNGFTLFELLTVLAVIGIATAIVMPAMVRSSDRVAVAYQATRIVLAYREAWTVATSRQRLASLRITPDSIAIRTIRSAGDPDTQLVSLQPGPRPAGVDLQSPPHTAVFGPDGVGLGAGNATHLLVRGRVSRRIIVSRLGRVRLDRE